MNLSGAVWTKSKGSTYPTAPSKSAIRQRRRKQDVSRVSMLAPRSILPFGPGPWSMLPNQGVQGGRRGGESGHDWPSLLPFRGIRARSRNRISADGPLLADIRTPLPPSTPYFPPTSSPCPELLHHLQRTPQNVYSPASPATRAGPREPAVRKLRGAHGRIGPRGAAAGIHGSATAAGPGTVLQLRDRGATAAVHPTEGHRGRDVEGWHGAQDEVVEVGGDGSHHCDGGGRDRGWALRVSPRDLDSGGWTPPSPPFFLLLRR